VRTLLRLLLRGVLRIFFRRTEVSGAERVPRAGPVIFVLNHPNGLIDPTFLLCLAPRRVSFLAKAPLFHMPIIGAIARAFEAIPVHRRQDTGADLQKNAETFDAARAVLVHGGTIAVFPEGTSHSDPKLRPLKTGTARIALGAAAALPPNLRLEIVPVGLYYRAKQTFRSVALLHFGTPFSVERIALAAGAEPPAEPVLAVTARLEAALRTVTLEAEEVNAHGLIARAQHVKNDRRWQLISVRFPRSEADTIETDNSVLGSYPYIAIRGLGYRRRRTGEHPVLYTPSGVTILGDVSVGINGPTGTRNEQQRKAREDRSPRGPAGSVVELKHVRLVVCRRNEVTAEYAAEMPL